MLDRQRMRTFLLGGLAGVLAGMLFAPRSGKELRGSISDRAGEARERGRENFFETQERLRERLAETRETPRRPGPKGGPKGPNLTVTTPEGPNGGTTGQDPDEAEQSFLAEEAAFDFGDPPRARLRDVSRDRPPDDEAPGSEAPEAPGPSGASGTGDAERSEELRRKVRETRERLRERTDGPPDGGGAGR